MSKEGQRKARKARHEWMKSTPGGRAESIDKESSLPLQSSLLLFTVHNLLLHAKFLPLAGPLSTAL
jgi:hypothetical protein